MQQTDEVAPGSPNFYNEEKSSVRSEYFALSLNLFGDHDDITYIFDLYSGKIKQHLLLSET